MTVRVIQPRSDIVGTPEWAERLTKAIKDDHNYADRDVRLLAEHAEEGKQGAIWDVTLDDEPRTWERYCSEMLGIPASYIDAIIIGVNILKGKGYHGPITEQDVLKTTPGPGLGTVNNPAGRNQYSEDNFDNYQSYPQGDKPRHQSVGGGGTSQTYTEARLRRDNPGLYERVAAGELSANAAAIQAGWRKAQRRFSVSNDPEQAGAYFAQRVDRKWLESMVDAFYRSIE